MSLLRFASVGFLILTSVGAWAQNAATAPTAPAAAPAHQAPAQAPATAAKPATAAPTAATAAQPAKAAPAKAQAPAPQAPGKIIYNAWFTVTREGKYRIQFYNDKLEIRSGRLFFSNHLWKKEDDFINEESIGAYAENNADLTPVYFNFRTLYRTNETIIDGTFQSYPNSPTARQLTIKARKNGSALPEAKKTLAATASLSTFFSMWVARKLPTWKPGQVIGFSSVLENDLDGGFQPVGGNARLDPPDEFAKKVGASKLSLNFGGQPSYWWVDKQGVPFRIEFPSIQTVVNRSTEKEAQAFLQ